MWSLLFVLIGFLAGTEALAGPFLEENPAQAPRTQTVTYHEAWRLGGDEDAEYLLYGEELYLISV